MSVSRLSPSTQNYVKAIWNLQEWSNEPVTASALANKVGVRLSSASDAIRKLASQELVQHTPYGEVSLTEQGRQAALQMVRRHRLIECFLVEMLGYRWDQVHDEAEHLEHAVSDFMIARIDEKLGHPTRDPHGDPIPSEDGTISHPDAIRLSDVDPESKVRVERIADDDPTLLQYFGDNGLKVGSIVSTRPGAPYSDATEVLLEGHEGPLLLGQSATDAVFVTLLK
ncbi:metal-dependent transcriptional regulator [Corynebacterium spheniscorum]|uniref:Manganese transport regulator n=1 Tax=Corynebacterium spheniscorum TaxID=185761 RepID=A0A1I2Q941_9CORY|nr:metal-dependent transcriptional regulator [Corynebacterium spheniscorum]KAA8719617.1 metal-dependent transcriptional regulator [Corynebacterium spheniscorum]SFG24892.1 iron (metal) dependent repressor, DtxR family [Corynebacterium spheniscorum]